MDDNAVSDVFSVIMDIGASMLMAGGEVYRVEDTIARLIRAYGGTGAQVFAIPSNIVVTATFEGREITNSRRIVQAYTNFEVLHRVNDLARRLCRDAPGADEARALLRTAVRPPAYNRLQRMLIYALICFAFAIFFGGTLFDALVSAVIGVILFFVALLSKRAGGNAMFIDILSSAISALLAVTAVRLGLAANADKVIIGNIMLLIPGVELVNGMRDFIAGDIQTGIIHVAEALFLAVGIAVGAAGVLTLIGGGA